MDHHVPRPGDEGTSVYVAQDGSNVEVTFRGMDMRADARLREHEVFLLEYRFHWNEPDARVALYEEAVSLQDGLIVQQTMLCSNINTCDEDEPMIYWGSAGLPGGLGMGPIWAEGGFSPGGGLKIHPEVYTAQGLTLVAEPIRVADEACHRIHYTPELPRLALFQPTFSAVTQHFDLCDGTGMPHAFRTVVDGASLEFRLVESTAGSDGIPHWGRGSDTWDRERAMLPVETWWSEGSPRYLFDDGDWLTLSLPEAHREARRMDDSYDAIFDRDPEAMIVETFSGLSGTFDPGPMWLLEDPAETYRREILVNPREGNPQVFVVEKTITNPEGDPSVSYQMADPDDHERARARQARDLDVASMALEQVDPASVLAYFEENLQREPSDINFGHRLARDHFEDPLVRSDGYEVRVYARMDPEPGSPTVGVLEMSVDGPTGTLLRMNVPWENLPLTGSPDEPSQR